MKQIITAAAALMLGALAVTPATAAQVEDQVEAWGKCKACHHFSEEKKVGPGLKGVIGRHVGAMKDMQYSKALANGDWIWDKAHLRKWICNSKKAVKEFTGDDHAKTKMPAQNICDAAKQDEVIAKLKSL